MPAEISEGDAGGLKAANRIVGGPRKDYLPTVGGCWAAGHTSSRRDKSSPGSAIIPKLRRTLKVTREGIKTCGWMADGVGAAREAIP